MIITTTNIIEGREIKEYKGIVHAEVIFGANIFRDIFAALRDFFGGRSASYENVLKDAKKEAVAELVLQAKSLDADAIVGLDFDFETIGGRGSMLMVHVSGTAVKLN